MERHEIAVYENLIEAAEAMNRTEVVGLLQKNLGSEQSALEKVKALSHA